MRPAAPFARATRKEPIMPSFIINDAKINAVPASLKAWSASSHKGPKAAVADLQLAACTDSPIYTLKGYQHEMGAFAHVLADGHC